ncbi:MAG: epoxyqueuosine reductase QueH [Candidatus Heteroscillospira sp.]|jgi:predicted adenine nucleotide alpha hydrolase (AANH) superfamily ATPase
MKINYQLQTDAVIKNLTGRPRLLLHSCCGPCSSYVIEYLRQYFDLTVHFYNPNIQPEEEYAIRLETQKRLLAEMCPEVPILENGWDGPRFDEAVRGLENEPEGGARCSVCFALRLERTAREAAERGFDYFASTLTVSPHKDAQRINSIGVALGEKYGVKWLPSDFKKREGYKRSIQLSAQYGLYRQDYCGCLHSLSPLGV